MGPETVVLLKRVARRRYLAALAARFHLFLLFGCGLYLVALLLSRLLTLIPARLFDVHNSLSLLILAALPVLSLLLALILTRRPTPSQAARLIDLHAGSHDVFLTAVRIQNAIGDFKPLVLADAESRAPRLAPRALVPYAWLSGSRNLLVAVALLAAALLFLPQLDLFGKNKSLQELRNRQNQLAEARKAVQIKLADLQKSDPAAENSAPVKLAVEDLKQTFNAALRTDPKANLRSLSEDQLRLSDLWRKISQEKLADALARGSSSQSFGALNTDKQQEWKNQLQKGDLSGLQKELAEIKDMSRKLDTLSREEQAKMQADMQKRIKELSDFVQTQLNSKACSGALAQALDQLALTGVQGLSQEALKALQESLDLSEMELSSLVQSAKDLKSLEEALKTLQLAKRLNDLEALDGSDCAGCKGMGDYAELYRKLMAQTGDQPGVGPGMEGPGIGEGGQAPEDDTAKSDFVPEQSRSAMTAGKMLLQWKVREVSDPGKANLDYARQVQEVKKGVSEAILREQVPPGYHEAIRQYFDSLEEKGAPAPKP